MKDILIIVPTRERAKNIPELYRSWKENTSGKSDILFVIENDDLQRKDYPVYPDVHYYFGDFGSMCRALNAAFQEYPEYKYYFFMGDDHRFRTKEWEEKLMASLQSGGIAYGNDLLQGATIPTACMISGDIPRKLGHLAYPQFIHLFIDNYWLELGKAINKLFYLPEVIIEHLHPAAGKAEMDAGYVRVNSAQVTEADRSVFHAWLSEGRQKEVDKLCTF